MSMIAVVISPGPTCESGFGPEGGDGVGRGLGLVVQSTGEAGEVLGAVGPVDGRAVVDDPEPPLDGPHEVVGLEEVSVGVGVDVTGVPQGVERLPEVRPG